jgi:hypothetical protein
MVGILGDQHLSDERLGGDAAFDDARRRRSLDHRALAGPAAIAWPTRDQHAEGGRHDVEPFGDILADLVERAAAAGAGLVIDIDDLLDPFEVCGQRAAVGLARLIILSARGLRFAGDFGMGERRLYILKTKVS